MKPEQVFCPHCGDSMRMFISPTGHGCFQIECWMCGVRSPRMRCLQDAIEAFLSMFPAKKEVA